MTNYPTSTTCPSTSAGTSTSTSTTASFLSYFSPSPYPHPQSISSASPKPSPYRIVIPSSEEFHTRRLEASDGEGEGVGEDRTLLHASSASPFGTPSRRHHSIRHDPIKSRPRLPSLPYQNIPVQQQRTYYSNDYVFPTPPPGPARVLTTPSPLTANRQVVDFEEWSIYETYLNDPEYQKKLKKVTSSHTYSLAGFRIRIPPVTSIIPYLLFIGALLIIAYIIYSNDSSSTGNTSPFRFPGQSSTSTPVSSTPESVVTSAGGNVATLDAGLANIVTHTQSQSLSQPQSQSQSQSQSPPSA